MSGPSWACARPMVSGTVIVCTHNRVALLGRTVRHALAEAVTCDADVLVVDNASTDATPGELAALEREAGPRLYCLREPRLGLSAARNRGLAEARGEVVVFLDDDAVPRPGWLAALLAPYSTPEVACVGGRIMPHFAGIPPSWIRPELYPSLGVYDLGDEPRRISNGRIEQYPFGGNISFRMALVRALKGFSTQMGLRGRSGLQQEETDLCYRIERAGGEVHYVPSAVVDHWISPERLRPEWFLARFRDYGRSNAMFELRNRGLHRALGLLRWYYRPYLMVAPYRPREPIDAERLVAECRRREALGYLLGLGRGVVRLRTLRRG